MNGLIEVIVSLPRNEQVRKGDLQGVWRMDSAANFQAFTRQLEALKKVAIMGNDKGQKQSPLWELLMMGEVGGKNIDGWAAKLQHGTASLEEPREEHSAELATLAATEPKVAFLESRRTRPEDMRRRVLETEMVGRLNVSQREAVAAALFRRFTIIQGPPGTGKTHVSAELLRLWKGMKIGPVLVTSHNNVAVDNIAENAIRKGLTVVRVGRSDRVSPEMEQCCLERLVPRSDDPQSDYLDKQRLLKRADVVCATTIASSTGMLSRIPFEAILMDEAAQATEVSSIVPIMTCKAERLVLVGDQCQLPANSISFEAENRGITLSLFSRFLNQGVEPYFLDTQFRMHPAIAEHSSAAFYNNGLFSGVKPEDRIPPAGFPWPNKDAGVALLGSSGSPEERNGESWSNPGEAQKILSILTKVLEAGELAAVDIGVVTPYVGQIRVLRQAVREMLPPGLLGNPRDLDIQSVDGFQGREKELIIFSAVRSNRRGHVGFLADWRRLNVMVTRARRGLVVVCDTATLQHDRHWAAWIKWAKKEGFEVTSDSFRNFSGQGFRFLSRGSEERHARLQELQTLLG